MFVLSCFDKIKRCGDRAKATAGPVDLWVGSMNPAEQRGFVAEHMDSDLQFILDDSGVALGNMVAIARRYGSLRRFNALGDDRAGIRAACLADFAIPLKILLTIELRWLHLKNPTTHIGHHLLQTRLL